MSHRIHDVERNTTEPIVRSLLEEQCPAWSHHTLAYLQASGTDNAMWRIHRPDAPDLVVRLPRTPGAALALQKELALLPILADHGIVAPRLCHSGTPSHSGSPSYSGTPSHSGTPTDTFDAPWAVLEWLEGTDAWTARTDLVDPFTDTFAEDLANTIKAIRTLTNNGALSEASAPLRKPGERGGPLLPLLADLDGWLRNPRWNAASLIDLVNVRRISDQAHEYAGEWEPVFSHGDLIPGNVVVHHVAEAQGVPRLAALIDWGGAGVGDPAQDLAPAWSLLDRRGRAVFREAMECDAETWMRGRAIEMTHAVTAILYYRPKGHELAEVMTATLARILT
jgi:aminoglycoside phosphotransferase (APT) family kinase protein